MRNETCVETQTSEVPTRVALLFLFCATVKVAADWASDSIHFNRLKVDFRKDYFQLFLRYFSLQISVIMSNTTYLFIADRKLRKHARL